MAYSWITPKTNWTSGDFCTEIDFNRIINNILYLYDEISLAPLYPDLLPTLTPSDFVTYDLCNSIKEEVYQLYAWIDGMSDYSYISNKTVNSSPWGSSELNTIESILLNCKEILDSGEYVLNYAYAGIEMYGDNNVLI